MVAKSGTPVPDRIDEQTRRLALLGEILAETVHEVNNLMLGVLGYADMELHQRQAAEGPEACQNLERIVTFAAEVRELTRNLLAFARPSAPGTAGNVGEAATSVLALFRHRMKGVEVRGLSGGRLPAVALPTADLKLVLANLVKNALDALDGQPAPALAIEAETGAEGVALGVWNSGPAIPDEVLSQLLTPFFSTKAEGEGTGLGLAVVNRVLRKADGALSVCNDPVGGVRFTVTLPLAGAAATPPSATLPAPAQPHPLEGCRVLVVDDDTSAREVLRLMVADLGGAKVDTCASGEEALSALQDGSFDAVVLDIRMAGLSGSEVYRRLPRSLQRRVVFVTGDTAAPSTRRFLAATRQPSLYKPVDWRHLLEAVEKVSAA
ncbi:MAG: hybrid sensor histidine kinase/response regulator [Deferrisomatales bacterium]